MGIEYAPQDRDVESFIADLAESLHARRADD